MNQSIAITGQGIICAIGTDCDSVLSSLLRGEDSIAGIQYLSTSRRELPAGEVKMSDDELKKTLGISSDVEVSRTSLLGAVAVRQALESSGLSENELHGRRVTFISGTTVAGMDVTERHYPDMLSSPDEARNITRHDCGGNTEEIATLCGLKAESLTISTACSSALNAIITGVRMLLAGETDIVIAGGSEALSRFHLNGFNSLMILDKAPCRPFDASRGGLNLGEGAAYIVLERTSDNSNRSGKAPLGYIGGYGNRCDAFHQTATSENGEGAYLAMSDALDMSGLSTGEIDCINAHGTGTPDNDRSESCAIRRLFGDSYPPVSATKAYTGHTTSASGSIETVICLLSMRHFFIPAPLRWENESEDCIRLSPAQTGISLTHMMCNSFGFGGNDSSLIISATPIELPEIPADTEIYSTHTVELTDADDQAGIKKYVSPMEARRMNRIIKAAIVTSMKALEEAGIERPDAIIEASAFGMLEQGEKILDHLAYEGEEGLSPTLFMQSTHNTIAGTLATRLKCHGYNITYSHGEASWRLAVEDARRLIREGKARHVLVGLHDFCPEHFRSIFTLAGLGTPGELTARSIVISSRTKGKEVSHG